MEASITPVPIQPRRALPGSSEVMSAMGSRAPDGIAASDQRGLLRPPFPRH